MKKYELINVDSGCATFKARYGYTVTEPCSKLVRNGLIEFFSPQDAQQIVGDANIKGGRVMARLSGSSLWVPESRMQYLPFFILMFGMLLIAA